MCVIKTCFIFLITKPCRIVLTKASEKITQHSSPFTSTLWKYSGLLLPYRGGFQYFVFFIVKQASIFSWRKWGRSSKHWKNGPASSVTSLCFSVLCSRGWIVPCWQGSQPLHPYYEEALNHGREQLDFEVIHPSWSCSCFGTGCNGNILYDRYVSLKLVTDGAQLLQISVSRQQPAGSSKFMGHVHRWDKPMGNFK